MTYDVCSTVPAPERCALVDRRTILAAIAFAFLTRSCGGWLGTSPATCCVLPRLFAERVGRLAGCLIATGARLMGAALVIPCALVHANCASRCIICTVVSSSLGSAAPSFYTDDAYATTSGLAMACLPISFFHLFVKGSSLFPISLNL